MRLIKEMPQVETAIASGELNLSNVSQAQTVFKNVARENPARALGKTEKMAVLNSLKNKSARQGQAELLKFQPQAALPKEKERLITETQSQVSFVMSDALKLKLEKIRALLGVRGAGMSYAELFDEMAELSVVALEAKKFGKKRSESIREKEEQSTKVTPASQVNSVGVKATSPNKRYISKALAQEVWKKYKSACANCGVSKNLQIDHIVPLGLGGVTLLSNLRLLCFNCNQRAAMKSFGVERIRNYHQNGISASGGDCVT